MTALVICAGGCAHTVTGSARPAASTTDHATPLVESSALPTLLPPLEVTRGIIQSPSPIQMGASYNKPDHPPQDGISDPGCLPALNPGIDAAYSDSGFTAMYGQKLGNFADAIGHGAEPDLAAFNRRAQPTVVAFDDADRAERFVAAQVEGWKPCAGKTIQFVVNKTPVSWTMGAMAQIAGLPVLSRTQEGGGGFACAHTMTARSNIVIDTAVCSMDTAGVPGQTVELANAIAERLPK